jgi:hypothetical protein
MLHAAAFALERRWRTRPAVPPRRSSDELDAVDGNGSPGTQIAMRQVAQ